MNGFKNFYVTLNENEEDYAHQTELGKKLGLEHKGKGVYENKSGDKYFFNKNSGTFKGWKGVLDPSNPDHHVKTEQSSSSEKLEHEVLQAKVAELKKKHPDKLSMEHETLAKKIGKEHGIRHGLVSDFADSYPKEESQKNLEAHGKEIKEELDERDTKKSERAKYVQENKDKNVHNVDIINHHLENGGEIHVPSSYKTVIYNKKNAGEFKLAKDGGIERGSDNYDHSRMIYKKDGKSIGIVNNQTAFGAEHLAVKNLEEYKSKHEEIFKPKSFKNDAEEIHDHLKNGGRVTIREEGVKIGDTYNHGQVEFSHDESGKLTHKPKVGANLVDSNQLPSKPGKRTVELHYEDNKVFKKFNLKPREDVSDRFDRITNSKISHDVNSLKERNAENVKVINKHLSDGGKIHLHYEKSNGEHVYPKPLTKNDAGKIKVDDKTGHIVDENGKSLENHEMSYRVHEGLHSGHVLGYVNNTYKIKNNEYFDSSDQLLKNEKDYVDAYNDKVKTHGKLTFKNNLDHWDTDKKQPEKEPDLSKNKDGSDFEEYDNSRFKKPEQIHERFEVHGHNFVVHSSRRIGVDNTYDKHSISHESGLPINSSSFKKKNMEQNVQNVKRYFGDFKDHDDLKQHLNKLYSDVAHEGKFYPNPKDFKNQFDFGDHDKFVKPLREKFEKHLGDSVKKIHEKRGNSIHDDFTEKVGDRTYVERSHFTVGGGMDGGKAVDRHNKTGKQVLYDDNENKYYLGDKTVQPYDSEAFLRYPNDPVKYKTMSGETRYTSGEHSDRYKHPYTPEDKHFAEVKKQQVEMAHGIIRDHFSKLNDNEKADVITGLENYAKTKNEDHIKNRKFSESATKLTKAASYLGSISGKGFQDIMNELKGAPMEEKNPGKFKISLTDRGEGRDGKTKKVEIKHLDEFEHLGHKFVIHKRHYLKDGKIQKSNEYSVTHKDSGTSVTPKDVDKKDNIEMVKKKSKAMLDGVGKSKLDNAVADAIMKNKDVEDFKE